MHVAIHNTYKLRLQDEGRSGALEQLRAALEANKHMEQIAVGDFNLHHELRGGNNIRSPDTEANELIELMDDFDLTSQLPAGTITYEEGDRRTTINLCLTTVSLVERLIRCGIDSDANHDSDHLPIVTSLDLTVTQLQQQEKRN